MLVVLVLDVLVVYHALVKLPDKAKLVRLIPVAGLAANVVTLFTT